MQALGPMLQYAYNQDSSMNNQSFFLNKYSAEALSLGLLTSLVVLVLKRTEKGP